MHATLLRIAVLVAAVCWSGQAAAGTISVAWNPVTQANLAGYRIYSGTSPGVYTDEQDVELVPSATLVHLANCARYYVAVKAIGAGGELSESFSNEISGYPRPLLSAATPSAVERGMRATIVFTGANFMLGATLRFDDANITVHSASVDSCNQISATITVGAAAEIGSVRVEVTNTDQTFGLSKGVLTVLPVAPPRVFSIVPPSDAGNVSVSVRPVVIFSRPMDPATFTPATVSLLDIAGNSLAQAAGSPVLSADGKTAIIVPAGDLAYESGHRIRVLGGAPGVRDRTGAVLTSDFVQIPGFTTERSAVAFPTVASVTPASLSTGVSVDVHPAVTFSEVMDPSTLTTVNVSLLDIDGDAVPQAAGSPAVSADRRTAIIVPAEPLAHASVYRIRVRGADSGVRDRDGNALSSTFVQTPGFVTAVAGAAPPSVLAVSPADSTQRVPVSVRPVVSFSEPMQASTITSATVMLVNSSGSAVSQTAGSPALSADGLTATIVPASPLGSSGVYRVRVIGGASGVRDLANEPMAVTFAQSVGFTTMADTAGPPRVTGVVPPSLATGVERDVRPIVAFSEPVSSATVTPATVLLLDPSGRAMAQAAGSPVLSPDGASATIVPAAALAFSTNYKVRVLGGSTGVKDLAGEGLPGTYTQASGFTTLADEVSPVVEAMTVAPQSTTAEIAWSTDEPAASRVFYRKEAAVTYQRPVEAPALVTSHAVRLVGLTPSSRYSFYVESADTVGNLTSSPEGFFTTSTSPYDYLVVEAEGGRLSTPVRNAPGGDAFQGAWIETPAFTPTGKATAPSGKSELSFFVPQTGSWFVWLRLYGGSAVSDSWFESVDGATRRAVAPPATGSWEWMPARAYELTAGLHVLELGGFDALARADRVIITNDPAFVATEQPDLDIVPPDPPSGLTASPGDGRATLAWVIPPSGAARVVIRYRTDGQYPASPADGFPAGSVSAGAGSPASFPHTGLTNGTTYRYSVFSIDDSGNASPAAQTQATPTP